MRLQKNKMQRVTVILQLQSIYLNYKLFIFL